MAPDILKYIVEKGYITVDGTSLTVCEVTETYFTFMLIQHTQSKVIIPNKKIGDLVNLEVDFLGKHVERYMAKAQKAADKKTATKTADNNNSNIENDAIIAQAVTLSKVAVAVAVTACGAALWALKRDSR